MGWTGEVSRDLMALGSLPFLVLVLARIWIADNYLQMFQMVLAVVLLVVVGIFWKGVDQYAGRFVVIGVFTSLFYMELKFTVFVIAAGAFALFGMWKYLERQSVFLGALMGGIVSGVGWWVSGLTRIVNS